MIRRTRCLRPGRFTLVTLSCLAMVACTNSSLPEATGGDGSATVSLWTPSDATGAMQKAADRCNATSNNEFTIALKFLDGDSGEQRRQITRGLSAKDSTIDAVAMDSTWTAEFAHAGWVRPFTGIAQRQLRADSLGAPLASATYDKRMYAAPFSADTAVIWYRKDLITVPPAKWQDIVDSAASLRAKKRTDAIVSEYSGGASLAEWLNALTAGSGARLLNDDGDRAVVGDGSRQAAAVLSMLAQSPSGSAIATGQSSAAARLSFEAGNAAYFIGPASAYSSDNSLKKLPFAKHLGYTPWPAPGDAGKSTGVSTGTNLGVSAYSKHQNQATKAVLCLRSAEVLRTFASAGAALPATSSAYDGVIDGRPEAGAFKERIANAAPPIATPVYGAVTDAVLSVITPVSAMDTSVVNEKLENAINNVLRAKGVD